MALHTHVFNVNKSNEDYTTDLSLLDCSIEGQIRKPFASHPLCHARCYQFEGICPLIAITDGCECPVGMVIHDLEKRCVHPEECPGTVSVVAIV